MLGQERKFSKEEPTNKRKKSEKYRYASDFPTPVLLRYKLNIHTQRQYQCQGSSFSETTLDCLLRLATFVNTTDRHDGAHQGWRTFCSPFKQATT